MLKRGIALALLGAGMVLAQATPSPVAATQAPSPAAGPGQPPAQPIPFSHKIHAGTANLSCDTCHQLSKSGQSLTIPQGKFCMQCHQTIAADKPDVQRLAALSGIDQPIPWVRIYATPSFVRFSHKMHLGHNNGCKECHGDVSTRDQLFKETDISMAGCLSCHNAKKASTGCDTCHNLEHNESLAPDQERINRGASRSLQSASGSDLSVPYWHIQPLS